MQVEDLGKVFALSKNSELFIIFTSAMRLPFQFLTVERSFYFYADLDRGDGSQPIACAMPKNNQLHL